MPNSRPDASCDIALLRDPSASPPQYEGGTVLALPSLNLVLAPVLMESRIAKELNYKQVDLESVKLRPIRSAMKEAKWPTL